MLVADLDIAVLGFDGSSLHRLTLDPGIDDYQGHSLLTAVLKEPIAGLVHPNCLGGT